jgi:hypothetical protein
MDRHLCKPCDRLVVEKKVIVAHHKSFLKLKACAEDPKHVCPVCRVLWHSVYTKDGFSIDNLQRGQLFLFIFLLDEVPETLHDSFQLERQHIHIRVDDGTGFCESVAEAGDTKRFFWAADRTATSMGKNYTLGRVNIFTSSGK